MASEQIRQKLLGKFREVTADRVERIVAALHALPEGRTGEDPAREAARELHTLKGEARMMGFAGIAQITHAAEEVLPLAAAAKGGPQAALIVDVVQALPALLNGPPDGGPEGAELLARLQAARGPTVTEPAPTPDPTPAPTPATPAPAPASGGSAAAVAAARAVAQATESNRAASIRVSIDALDRLSAMIGDLLVDGARARTQSRRLAELLADWGKLSDRIGELLDQARGALPGPEVDAVEDEFWRLRDQNFRTLRQHVDSVERARESYSRIAEEIGDARLVPLGEILARFPLAARDQAREHGKEVDCQLRGVETGVDRAILLSLTDPLVHLLRNAIDHGLEAPAERASAGKPSVGRIVISARTDGDLLQLAVEDDGRGIDPARIRESAAKKGLITVDQATSLTDRAAIDLIFAPGFSTKEVATETSGRGVGLDVVRKRVTGFGGSVSVTSTPGKGSRFLLRLPQSLALMKVLLFRLDDDVYGLPAMDVDSVGRVEPASILEIAGVRAVRHRERVVPVVALGPLLAINGGPRSERPNAAFVSHGDHAAAIVVDGFVGEREVAVKTAGEFLKGMRFVSGAAALEDGRVALLLSTGDVLAAARRAGSVGRGPHKKKLRVLLVDDSMIAREAEAALLRALGHDVDEAADGEEGWQQLQAGAYDLLVTDVQMPRLDGIGLTLRVRGSLRFRATPVVVLSSLSAPHERKRGLEAGADAYLAKNELEGEALASTIERLCGVAR